jgi:hypothetical protein
MFTSMARYIRILSILHIFLYSIPSIAEVLNSRRYTTSPPCAPCCVVGLLCLYTCSRKALFYLHNISKCVITHLYHVCDIRREKRMSKLWPGGLVDGLSPRSPGFASEWDSWWTKWHCDRFLSEFFCFSLSISFHCGSPYSYDIWDMNNRPVGGRSSET